MPRFLESTPLRVHHGIASGATASDLASQASVGMTEAGAPEIAKTTDSAPVHPRNTVGTSPSKQLAPLECQARRRRTRLDHTCSARCQREESLAERKLGFRKRAKLR